MAWVPSNSREGLPHSSGGQKPEIRASVGMVPLEALPAASGGESLHPWACGHTPLPCLPVCLGLTPRHSLLVSTRPHWIRALPTPLEPHR